MQPDYSHMDATSPGVSRIFGANGLGLAAAWVSG